MTTVAQDLQALDAVRVAAKAASPEELAPTTQRLAPPAIGPGEALVRVAAAGVNPSDVKACMGQMPQAVWPRTPGRDYAGTVVAGPAEWVGRDVWGSGGDLGITRDGSHGGWLKLPVAALQEKPARLSMAEAGAVGVPFVTAVEGWQRAGGVKAGQVVAVMGANGRVGQAAVQLAAQAGARVIAVRRGEGPYGHFACTPVEAIDSRGMTPDDLAARLRELTGGRGVEIAFNTVGSPYFEAVSKGLAKRGTQVLISTLVRPVPFDILVFFRNIHTFVGVDTLAFDAVETGARIATLREGFEAGTLAPFPVAPSGVYPLERAAEAYRLVIGGASERIVLQP